jgi:asparagine synthetase B (glutamine-hydrolysing)
LNRRADPGIYMVCDPHPHRARAAVQSILAAAGTIDHRVVAIEGPGFAAAAVSPPADEPSCGPGLHCDQRGLLIWAGEMFLPAEWCDQAGPASPRGIAATARHKLITRGPGALADIDGSFCGAWFDGENSTWTVFNDRWGLIPLFWWSQQDRFIIAPRARLGWQASESPLNIDENGVADLLRTQNMLDDHTLIAGVHWLEPAHALTWDGRHTRCRRYWEFQHRPVESRSAEEAVEGYLDAARPTIARMAGGQSPVLQGLSGGLDSRLFLAVCHEQGWPPACYTSGFAYGEDVRFGRQLASVAGATHQALLLDKDDFARQLHSSIVDCDGLHGAGHLAASAPIAEHLAGLGGAVLLEGYLHGVLGGSDLPADSELPTDLPPYRHGWARDFLHGGGDPESIGRLLREDLAADSLLRWQTHVDDAFSRAAVREPLYRAEHAIIAGRSGRNDVLVPAMYRRHVLVRHPACDRRMIDWYATTPARLRRARQVYIEVLRRHYPAFARVPRADGCSGMPLLNSRWRRELAWQREKLFARWAWLRYTDVRRWGRDSIATRAWAFQACRQTSAFEPLLAPDARVLQWIRPASRRLLWEGTCRDPRQSVVLLTLLTIETMVRHLEQLSPMRGLLDGVANVQGVEFKRLRVGQVETMAAACPA